MKTRMWLLGALVACAGKTAPTPTAAPTPAPTETSAAAADSVVTKGITSPELASIVERYWNANMERYPTWATELGDHRFDEKVEDLSPSARSAWRNTQQKFRSELGTLTSLSSEDALTARLLDQSLHASVLEDSCSFDEWQFSARDNPLISAHSTAEVTTVESDADAQKWIARIDAFAAQLDTDATNRALGAAAGKAPSKHSVELVLEQVRPLTSIDPSQSPLFSPVADRSSVLQENTKAAIERHQQALAAWLAAIETTVLPVAREAGAKPGLTALPGGDDCYAAMIEHHTSLPLTAEEVHQTGLDEIARLHREVAMLGKQHADRTDVQDIFEWLRTDKSLYFEDAEQVEAKAREALARAKAAIPDYFGILPQTDCGVERIPAYLAPYTTIAYYHPLALGERPGTYFVNVHEPTTRPRHEAEVLAFHESIPGHHLQIAISQEREDLPLFRRHMMTTAFVEGWALYTEQLADEMGLYSGPTDRFGMYSFELWRAARLVVDTGIHAKGWSRERAIEYMVENTPLARNNIVNEVDRYINTPGQALAYKTGQLEIWKLRREAEAELGEKFDIKGFHDVVLGAGAVTLPVLGDRLEAWKTERQALIVQ